MTVKKIFKILAAGSLFIAGYYTNNLLAGPEQLQQRLESRAAKAPAKYTAVMEKAFDFSYGNWVDGQRGSGADVSIVQGIKPEIYLTESNTSMSEARLGITDNAAKPEQAYAVRRMNSDIANKLGTNLACGSPEQGIDQFIGTIAENSRAIEDYPEKKAEIVKDYALNGLKESLGAKARWFYKQIDDRIKGL